MSGDRQSRPERRPDNSFEDALDDLFGPGTGESRSEPDPAPLADPTAEKPITTSPPRSASYAPYLGESRPASSSKPRRSIGRTIGIGCGVVVALVFFCLAILTIIGLVADDDTGASSIDTPVTVRQAVATAPVRSSSYTPDATIGIPEDLVPLSSYVSLDDSWRVAVVKTIPDATEMVLEENIYNESPAAGRQFFIATVSVEHTGADPDLFAASFLFRAVGESGQEYTTFDDYCGVVPDPFPIDPVPPGTVYTGNICWSVRVEDADTLVMRSIDILGTYEEHFFALYE